MAQLRNERGRKSVVNVNLRGADDMGLRQREVDIVQAVDAVQLDLRRASVGESEGVVILARSDRCSFAMPAEVCGALAFACAWRMRFLERRLRAS